MNQGEIRKKTKDFYNQSAQSFSRTRNYWWEDLSFIKEYIPQNGKLLDLGCGNGRLANFLRENNFKGEYIGADISEKLIRIAQENNPKGRFKLIKNEKNLPFENEIFDAVVAVSVFHHFNPSMAEKALKEIKRISKPNAVIIITSWNLWQKKYLRFLGKNIFNGRFSLMAEITFKDSEKVHFRPCYWWTRKKFKRKAEKIGFNVLKSGCTVNKKKQKRNIYFIFKKQSI